MNQSDETDESGNEYLGENKSNHNNMSYWGVLYKNRRQTTSVIGGMLKSENHIQS